MITISSISPYINKEHDLDIGGQSHISRKHCSALRRTTGQPDGGGREKNMDGMPTSRVYLPPCLRQYRFLL